MRRLRRLGGGQPIVVSVQLDQPSLSSVTARDGPHVANTVSRPRATVSTACVVAPAGVGELEVSARLACSIPHAALPVPSDTVALTWRCLCGFRVVLVGERWPLRQRDTA